MYQQTVDAKFTWANRTDLKEPEVSEVERVVGVVEDDEVRRVEEEEEGARKVERARGEQRQETADEWSIAHRCVTSSKYIRLC